ncbi:MAG: flagellar basal body-associated FliL family protein [Gemmatimonadota bacterium]|nr:flagellar basal body-associated FliL family protein [Gemmatimonadota bacterium]
MAEATPPEAVSEEPIKKAGVAGKLPLIGGVVGGLALGATLGFTMLGPKLSPKSAPAATGATAASGATAANEGTAPKRTGAAPSIYQLDNLVLNPAGTGGAHFLLMSIALEVKDAGSLELLKGRDAELRDGILRLLSKKTIEQVTELQARDQFASELQVVLAKMFGDGVVVKIYFPQFVIQ